MPGTWLCCRSCCALAKVAWSRRKKVADYVGTLSDDVEAHRRRTGRKPTSSSGGYATKKNRNPRRPVARAFAVAREAAWRVLDQRPFDDAG